MNKRIYYNHHAVQRLDGPPPNRTPLALHRRMPGYTPTPLVDLPQLAAALGVGRVWLKDESSRLGLPSFKILGASWAVHRALVERLGHEPGAWDTIDDLATHIAPLRPLTLVTATDGNHGRAVARMAALLGLAAHILVPAGTSRSRIDAIAGEGATVTVVDGCYDDAVALAATMEDTHALVVSDTAWPGYERIPWWTIEGYATIFWEIDDELARRRDAGPDLIVAQIGVGALAAAVVRHYRRAGTPGAPTPPRIVGVEPLCAACVLTSIEAGRRLSIPAPYKSIMAGLNAGTPSLVAWPLLQRGVDVFVAIDEEWARRGMRALAAAGVVAGETGAAGIAGLLDVLRDDEARAALGVDASTRILALSTEGATDPLSYQAIVSQPPELNRWPS